MARVTPPRLTAVVVLSVVALGTLRWFVPFLTSDRLVITSTPSLAGVFSSNEVRVKPRAVLCVAPVPFDPESDLVRLNITSTRRAATLVLVASAPGYTAHTRIVGYALGSGVGVSARLPSPRRETTGSLCVRNEGSSAVALTGTQEPRSLVFAQTTVNGKLLPAQGIALSFFAGHPKSLAARAGALSAHVSAFAGGLLPTWLVGGLAIVFALGVPLMVACAFLRDKECP